MMSHPTLRRVLAGLTVFICALVLLLSVAGIVGTWVGGRAATDAAVQLFDGVDRAAGAARILIAQVNTQVGQVRDQLNTVKSATDQLSQNVNDKGLVLTLIPPETDSQLLASVRGVVEAVATVREGVASALDLYRALNALPFVRLPQPDPTSWGAVGDAVLTLQTAVQTLTTTVDEFRSTAAGSISRVTDAVATVDERLNNTVTLLNRADAELAAAQAQIARLRQTLPTAITVISVVFTLLALWVAYTQIVVMRGAWPRVRGPRAGATLPNAETAGA